jgi:lactoylglutathione lyase
MHIEHVAYWVKDLDKMKKFYLDYFEGTASSIYKNPSKNFTSCFISFETGGRLELMHKPDKLALPLKENESALGITHLAFSVGSRQRVDTLTSRLEKDGFKIIGQPRTTGDGFYESVILDPESNRIEITE